MAARVVALPWKPKEERTAAEAQSARVNEAALAQGECSSGFWHPEVRSSRFGINFGT